MNQQLPLGKGNKKGITHVATATVLGLTDL